MEGLQEEGRLVFAFPLKEWLAHGNCGTSIPSTPGTKPCASRHVPERGDEEVARSHVEREEPFVRRRRHSREEGLSGRRGVLCWLGTGRRLPRKSQEENLQIPAEHDCQDLPPRGRGMLLFGTGKTVALSALFRLLFSFLFKSA